MRECYEYDEVIKVAENFAIDTKLLISETEKQENLLFNLADEKPNATSVNKNTKVVPLLGHLPPLNLKKDGGTIVN